MKISTNIPSKRLEITNKGYIASNLYEESKKQRLNNNFNITEVSDPDLCFFVDIFAHKLNNKSSNDFLLKLIKQEIKDDTLKLEDMAETPLTNYISIAIADVELTGISNIQISKEYSQIAMEDNVIIGTVIFSSLKDYSDKLHFKGKFKLSLEDGPILTGNIGMDILNSSIESKIQLILDNNQIVAKVLELNFHSEEKEVLINMLEIDRDDSAWETFARLLLSGYKVRSKIIELIRDQLNSNELLESFNRIINDKLLPFINAVQPESN